MKNHYEQMVIKLKVHHDFILEDLTDTFNRFEKLLPLQSLKPVYELKERIENVIQQNIFDYKLLAINFNSLWKVRLLNQEINSRFYRKLIARHDFLEPKESEPSRPSGP